MEDRRVEKEILGISERGYVAKLIEQVLYNLALLNTKIQ